MTLIRAERGCGPKVKIQLYWAASKVNINQEQKSDSTFMYFYLLHFIRLDLPLSECVLLCLPSSLLSCLSPSTLINFYLCLPPFTSISDLYFFLSSTSFSFSSPLLCSIPAACVS